MPPWLGSELACAMARGGARPTPPWAEGRALSAKGAGGAVSPLRMTTPESSHGGVRSAHREGGGEEREVHVEARMSGRERERATWRRHRPREEGAGEGRCEEADHPPPPALASRSPPCYRHQVQIQASPRLESTSSRYGRPCPTKIGLHLASSLARKIGRMGGAYYLHARLRASCFTPP
jgi:hypothetical protein